MRAHAAVLVLLLGGCAALAPGADEAVRVNEIVAQSVAAARAPAKEQQRALRLARDAYQRDRSAPNRLRLATLLAALPAPLRDDAGAYALLKPLEAGQADSPYASFGALLAGQVAERMRLERESARAAQESARTAQEYERAAHAAEERAHTLREQLDALKSIERGIVEREEKLRRNRR